MNGFNNIIINESDINKFSSNVSTNFRSSIKLNHKFKKEIEDIYARALLNFGKTTLSIFHLKYISMFETLVEHYNEDKELVEFSNSLISVINNYFEDLNSNLNIKNKQDLDNLNNIINISLFLLEETINDKNIDLAYESFFQIERKINNKHLYKKSDNTTKFLEVEYILKDDSNCIIKENKAEMNFKDDNLKGVSYEV